MRGLARLLLCLPLLGGCVGAGVALPVRDHHPVHEGEGVWRRALTRHDVEAELGRRHGKVSKRRRGTVEVWKTEANRVFCGPMVMVMLPIALPACVLRDVYRFEDDVLVSHYSRELSVYGFACSPLMLPWKRVCLGERGGAHE